MFLQKRMGTPQSQMGFVGGGRAQIRAELSVRGAVYPSLRRRGKQSARLSAGTFITGQKPKPTSKTQFWLCQNYVQEVKKTENRKRNKTITIRVTQKEWMAIMEQVCKAGMSVTEYLITAALNTEINVPEDTKPLLKELKRIGNNLNQISMKINAGAFQSYNFQEVIDLQRRIYEELYRISRGGDCVSLP